MKNLFMNIGSIGGILLSASILAGCAGTPDPVLEAARTPLMLGESSADRVVSLQTRTMLAGLACGSAWADPQAFARYASFTVRNADILRRSQRELAERMGGMAEFDQMHTRISNGRIDAHAADGKLQLLRGDAGAVLHRRSARPGRAYQGKCGCPGEPAIVAS